MYKALSFTLGLAAAVLAVACGGGEGGGQDGTRPPDDPTVQTPPSDIPPIQASHLRSVQTCEELSAAIKSDALEKLNDKVDAQVEQIRRWSEGQFGGAIWGPGSSSGFGGEADAPSAGSSGSGGASSSGSSGSSGAGGAPPPPSAPASDYSQTNTQVKGVDEADIVKNDGQYIYLLLGSSFQIVTSWPAPSLAASSQVAIEGQPTEMFVADGKAVVVSNVDGTPIYQAAGVARRSLYTDGVYRPDCYDWYSCAYPSPLTKVTVLGVSGTNAAVERELYFEGRYVSSRRVGPHVRVVLQGASYGPQLQQYPDYSGRPPQSGPMTPDEQIAGWEALRQKNAQLISATSHADWLPYAFAKTANGTTATLTACDQFYVPTESTTEYGITQIATFDLDKPDQPSAGVAIVGNVDTVYSNGDAMILAARAWISPKKLVERPADRKAPFVDYLPSTATYLHRFDLASNPSRPAYVASGAVPGTVLDQFSIDERAGVIRVATTENRSVRTWISDDPKVRPFVNGYTVNRVMAVRTVGAALERVGDVGDLAPGERIYSARFVGDKGYIVTFRQVDPLFVIDLATPEQPKLLGALKIPGFSEYMHPLDDGHLLTIGRDTENGMQRGLALQIFDVTTPTQPKLMHKYVFDSSSYGYSEAAQNHKAFTYYASKQLLSFPFYGWSPNGFRTSAELFHVDLATGITKLGSVDHTALFGGNSRGYCNGYLSPHVRRSVFMEDVLYSISYAGVIASDTKNLAAGPIAQLSLATPTITGVPYCM